MLNHEFWLLIGKYFFQEITPPPCTAPHQKVKFSLSWRCPFSHVIWRKLAQNHPCLHLFSLALSRFCTI